MHRTNPRIALATGGLTIVLTVGLISVPSVATASGGPELTIPLSSGGVEIATEFIPNAWTLDEWRPATTPASDFVSTHYPHVKKAQLMTATGGCYVGYPGCSTNRDLFADPSDTSDMTDYNFDPLVEAVGTMLDQGVTPFIKTGNVPIKYSTTPYVHPAFGVNIRPPANYSVYRAYMEALANALISEFTAPVVRTFDWGVLTEATNHEWFQDADNTQASTLVDFLKLYDFTVAGLEDALGSGNVHAGTHEFNNVGEAWIDHCASGTNYATSLEGSPCEFLSESHYGGSPGGGAPTFERLAGLKAYALTVGLDLRVGVDEGEFFVGPDSAALTARTTGRTWNGSYEAELYKSLLDYGISWHTKFSLSTSSVFGGPNGPVLPVDTNVDVLTGYMQGENRLTVQTGGAEADSSNSVDGVASFDGTNDTMHVMAFNHNGSLSATTAESATLRIENVDPTIGSTVSVRKWVVDENHGQFWNQWNSDRIAQGITNFSGWSSDSTGLPWSLADSSARSYFDSRESAYRTLSTVSSTVTTETVTAGVLELTPTLEHNGVVFYEISGVRPDVTTTSLVDELNDWSVTDSHTAGLYLDSYNAAPLEDGSRAARVSTSTPTAPENLVYNMNGLTSAQVTALFNSSEEAIQDMTFLTSSDATTWTSMTAGTSDTLFNGNSWTRRVYTTATVPPGTKYLKVQFATGGTHHYGPQLSRVVLNYVPQQSIDPLDDWTQLGGQGSHSSGLVFDTTNVASFGDTSRAVRITTASSPNEQITYHYPGATRAEITTLFNSGEEAVVDFQFDTSSDGTSWTTAPSASSDVSLVGGAWAERTYILAALPIGTDFIRIKYRTGGTHAYAPQVGRVAITQ